MTKYITLLLFSLVDCFLAQTTTDILVSGLGSVVEVAVRANHVDTEFHNGFIIVNSDTVRGSVKFGSRRIYYTNGIEKKSFKIKKVTSVRLFAADTLITNNGYMDFIHLGKFSGILYRRIYSGSFEIYDSNFFSDEIPGYIGNDLIILDEGKIIQDPASSSLPKKYMVKCINKKFNKDLKTSDFARKVDVIKWLQLNDQNFR